MSGLSGRSSYLTRHTRIIAAKVRKWLYDPRLAKTT